MTSVNLSYEFFPPQNDIAQKNLMTAAKNLSRYNPKFVSVTYGAGGTTQARTFDAVTQIAKTGLDTAAHLTCVDAKRAQIDAIIDQYWNAGIRRIVALRGDSPKGIDKPYAPTPGGYAYGSDLVAGIKNRHPFDISVSAYPELHPESAAWDAEIDNLKRKIDAGADRAITQYFFKAETFLRFKARVRAAGISLPIVPGIMLQANFEGLCNMSAKCGVAVPSDVRASFDPLKGDKAALTDKTAEFACGLIEDLRAGGVNDFHLYTLNKSAIAGRISRELRSRKSESNVA